MATRPTPPAIEPAAAAQLRTAVFTHAGSERRRIFGPVLHLGVPGLEHATTAAAVHEGHDHALRTDVVAAMITAHERSGVQSTALAWLTRTGELAMHDTDAAWCAPVSAAAAEAGLELVFAVVTKQGWWIPRSGQRRVWKRPRTR